MTKPAVAVVTALLALAAGDAVAQDGGPPAPTPAPAPAPSPAAPSAPADAPATTPAAAKPAPAPASAAAAKAPEPKKDAASAEVAREIAQKAKRLKDEVDALLLAEPGDARALENVSTSGVEEKVLAAEPALRPLLKLARGRALTIQSRYDEAASAFQDAKVQCDAVQGREQRRLLAQVKFRTAQLEELRTDAAKASGAAAGAVVSERSCGALGLNRVSALEGKLARERVTRLASKYKQAVQTGDRFWGRRGAFRTAVLYDELYRTAISKPPANLRGALLPSPFAVGRVDSRAAISDVLGGTWPTEISRLYSELIASIDARDPDDILLEQARKRAAAFAKLELPPGEHAENPWLVDEKPGLIRFNTRFERRGANGSWLPVDPKAAKDALLTSLQRGPGSVEHAYALVALAEALPQPKPEQILAAMKHDDERVKLAGILAAEKMPDPSFLEPLLEIAVSPVKGEREPFLTLQSSLYGLRERSLLALRALASSDRQAAEKILTDNKLHSRERAWVIAELGDGRLEYTLQVLASDRDPIVSSTAIYALYLSAGKSSLGYLRTGDTGVVGCVSRAIAAIDAAPRK